jgi:predicted GH43/DUF377 family glycosyl hydrolase
MLFTRYPDNPIIKPNQNNDYESVGTFNPAAAVHNNKIYIIYRALDQQNKSTLCLAISEDGYNFKKYPQNPIIQRSKSNHEKGGCEDPRITKIDDTYYLLYTSYNGEQPITPKTLNESYATSTDLIHWKKEGILIKCLKSAALLPEKINNKNIVFIGGENIKIGESKNLTDWKIDQKPILDIRKNQFDNRYVEVGPPPFIHDNKIVVFFNVADTNGIFYTSLALLDKNNPRKILYRADKPIMTPSKKYEKEGLVKNVIFGSGLILFQEKYFYYYGAADTSIGVATITQEKMNQYLSSLR